MRRDVGAAPVLPPPAQLRLPGAVRHCHRPSPGLGARRSPPAAPLCRRARAAPRLLKGVRGSRAGGAQWSGRGCCPNPPPLPSRGWRGGQEGCRRLCSRHPHPAALRVPTALPPQQGDARPICPHCRLLHFPMTVALGKLWQTDTGSPGQVTNHGGIKKSAHRCHESSLNPKASPALQQGHPGSPTPIPSSLYPWGCRAGVAASGDERQHSTQHQAAVSPGDILGGVSGPRRGSVLTCTLCATGGFHPS